MFDSICIKGKENNSPLNVGYIAQSLIYYKKVILILNSAEFLQLLRYCEPNLLIEFIQNGFLDVYIKESLLGPAYYPDGTYFIGAFYAQDKDTEFFVNDALLAYSGNRTGYSRRNTEKLMRYIKPYKYQSPVQNYKEFLDSDFCKSAVIETIKHYAPQDATIMADFDFDIVPIDETKFRLNYTLNHEAMKEKGVFVDPAGILLNVAQSYGDIMIGSEFNAEMSSRDLYARIAQYKFNSIIKRAKNSQASIDCFNHMVYEDVKAVELVINSKEKGFKDVLGVLGNATKFKHWLNDLDSNSNLLKEYTAKISEKNFLESTPAKFIRLYLFHGAGLLPRSSKCSDGSLRSLNEKEVSDFRYNFATLPLNQKSASTSAAIASTIGTARGTTQGSWRPLPFISVSLPVLSKVGWVCIIVATGLNATLK